MSQKYQARNVANESLPALAVCRMVSRISPDGFDGQDIAFFVYESDRQAFLKLKNSRREYGKPDFAGACEGRCRNSKPHVG